jgi:cytoskeletal protein CcmA (bactofilin family)
VEGRLDGEVEAEGTLLVAEGARVRARVEADRLVVAGVLEGDVHARESVELLPTARVSGRLRTGRLVVAEGARLEGDVQTLRSPGASRPGDPGGASSVLNFE